MGNSNDNADDRTLGCTRHRHLFFFITKNSILPWWTAGVLA